MGGERTGEVLRGAGRGKGWSMGPSLASSSSSFRGAAPAAPAVPAAPPPAAAAPPPPPPPPCPPAPPAPPPSPAAPPPNPSTPTYLLLQPQRFSSCDGSWIKACKISKPKTRASPSCSRSVFDCGYTRVSRLEQAGDSLSLSPSPSLPLARARCRSLVPLRHAHRTHTPRAASFTCLLPIFFLGTSLMLPTLPFSPAFLQT